MTLLVASGAGILAAGICAAAYLHDAGQVEAALRERERLQVGTYAEIFSRSFQSAANDVLTLASGDALQAYLAGGAPAELQLAEKRAQFYGRAKQAFDLVRYLDERGTEVFRITRGGARVAPAGHTSDADRTTFQDASGLAPGQVYISRLDLDAGEGGPEVPFRPTLRFATPVMDAAGNRRGVYMINYRAAVPFSRLDEIDASSLHAARVLNADGYWLKASDPAMEWGFQIPDRAGRTLARTDPTLWGSVTREAAGQAPFGGGLLTWRHFLPGKVTTPDGANDTVSGDRYLVVASEVSAPEWAAALRGLRRLFAILTLIVLALVGVVARFVHHRQLARAEQDRFFSLSLDLLCISSADGYFKRASNAVTDMLGWSVEEFLSRPFIDFVHPDDVEATMREVQRQVVAGEKVLHFENRYRTKDGSWRVLAWRSMPQPGGLMYATARDVTEARRVEREIQKLNADLVNRAAELESANGELEAFSYSVSHDLRAPLRHVAGFSGMLGKTEGASLSEKGRVYLKQIADSARQMGTLVDDLLAFSRMGRAEMRMGSVILGDLIREILNDQRVDLEGRHIEWRIGDLPTVVADRPMIRQVLVNLISNAVKYTAPRDPAVIEIGSEGGDEEFVFHVRDNGVGFEMEFAHKLFGVFQRLHRAEEFEGTGIGLANVRRIVGRHGGRTWAEGRPGLGATFFFSLPKKPRTTA